MTVQKSKNFILIAVLAAFAVQVLTWFGLYPLAGYNDLTLAVAQLVFLALGLLLFFACRQDFNAVGLGSRDFVRAVIGIAVSYGLLLGILLIAQMLGNTETIFRQRYNGYAFVNNWLLTSLGEELYFAGILFNQIALYFLSKRRWAAIPLTASLFALWHLPGYIAIGLEMGNLGQGLIIDLLLHMISWCFFGAIYLFSRNLWLTVFAHASTDYALLPAITSSPGFGLIFMAVTLIVAREIGRKRRFPSQASSAESEGLA